MKSTIRNSSSIAAVVVLASAANLSAVLPVAADINIGALACQAMSSTSDTNLLWSAHYLINPATSSGNRSVVCNIPFESASLPETFYVGAFGLNDEMHPNLTTTCNANVVDLRNQNVPNTFGGVQFLDNPGQDMSYTKIMSTKSKVDYLWSAWATFTRTAVIAAMMDPPGTPVSPDADEGTAFWTISINCTLKPGQALNMVSLWPTWTPETAP
ncbi:hypothetical protein [uncultured Lamprocystis sp.]|jgi:hypothetical protein|uniref:hypothetical protein n=1 Tax=uncultured Lamprocystis sp. TaxID=543132 RepID=UPI0025EE2447|nr:hypothetical protein [uncultured Lamprocystis sp.]